MTKPMAKLPRRKKAQRVLAILVLAPVVLSLVALLVAMRMQDALVAHLLQTINAGIAGSIRIQSSAIAPFADFPHVSVDVRGLQILEDPAHGAATVLHIDDIYLGLDLRRLLAGVAEIRSARVVGARLDLLEHADGTLNLANALRRDAPAAASATADVEPQAVSLPALDLSAVAFSDIRLHKHSETSAYSAQARISEGSLALLGSDRPYRLTLDANLVLTVLESGLPTFFHDHAVSVRTAMSFAPRAGLLRIDPSQVQLEDARFRVQGSVALADDLALDLTLEGDKPNFDLFLAFAPPEMAPLLEVYENQGRVYFTATAKGPSINGHVPALEIDFGCEDGILLHRDVADGIRNLDFRAHFSNGPERSAASSEFSLTGLSADPAAGYFRGDLDVRNFQAPEVDLRMDAQLDLEFLARFLGLDHLFDLGGEVRLQTRFRDVIDLGQPQRALERLRESYETRLRVSDLRFRSPQFPQAFEDVNIIADLEDEDLAIERLQLRYGTTRFSVSGNVINLPDLLHQRESPVQATLRLAAAQMDPGLLSPGLGDWPVLDEVTLPLELLGSGKALWELPAKRTGDVELRLTDARVDMPGALGPLRIPALKARLAGTVLSLDLPALQSGSGELGLKLGVDALPVLLEGLDRKVEISTEFSLQAFAPQAWLSVLAPAAEPAPGPMPLLHSAGGRLRLTSKGAALRRAGIPALQLVAEGLHADLAGGPQPLRDLDLTLDHQADGSTVLRGSGRIGDSAFSVDAAAEGLAELAGTANDASLRGSVRLTSPRLLLGDLRPRAGASPLPEDWAGETLEDLDLALRGELTLASGVLAGLDLELESLRSQLSVHALPLTDGRAQLHVDGDGSLQLRDAGLRLGESELRLDLALHPDAARNRLRLHAPLLDFDSLTLWTPPDAGAAQPDHDAGFSVFDLPFPSMRHELRIDRLTYHRMRIEDLQATLHTRPDHSGSIDELAMAIAGGRLSLRGEFNGEQRTRIRFAPRLELENVDLDQLLFKFENFGQDHLVSENLHGRLTGNIEGDVLLHADLTPLIDESTLEVDILVRDGMLERFAPLEALSAYFRDRNLARVRFGDLGNRLVIQQGVLEIPTMTVNTSLGFLELSGRQALAGEAEYLVRVPWKMVTGAGFSRLFGRRRDDVDPDQLDEIEYRDPERRVRFLTLSVASEGEDWRVGLARGR